MFCFFRRRWFCGSSMSQRGRSSIFSFDFLMALSLELPGGLWNENIAPKSTACRHRLSCRLADCPDCRGTCARMAAHPLWPNFRSADKPAH